MESVRRQIDSDMPALEAGAYVGVVAAVAAVAAATARLQPIHCSPPWWKWFSFCIDMQPAC
jgi:hypothetical protein